MILVVGIIYVALIIGLFKLFIWAITGIGEELKKF